jgi:AAA+ superfamily predicted ATPase
VQNIDSVRIPEAKNTVWPKNLLIFGAPGTGKSFAIDKKLADLGWKKYAQRVTFYEDYSYEKFVGSYIPKKANKE